MNVVDTLAYLPHDNSHILLIHPSFTPKFLQQLPSRTELNQQIYIFLVLEIPIQASNIPVLEIKLYAELSSNLANIVFLPDLLLLHDLEPTDPASLLMPDEHHLAELPLAHFLPHGEVCHLEFLQVWHLCGYVGVLLVHGAYFLDVEGTVGDVGWGWFWVYGLVDVVVGSAGGGFGVGFLEVGFESLDWLVNHWLFLLLEYSLL